MGEQFGGGTASAGHVRAAKPLLVLIAVLAAGMGVVLLVGGLYLAFAGKVASTEFFLFGNHFTSTSVGVSMGFIGAVLVLLTFRRIVWSIERLASLPEDRRRRRR